jgi:hypothetical protein
VDRAVDRVARSSVRKTRGGVFDDPATLTAKGMMREFDASDMDIGYVQCAVCEKVITGGKWFAQIKLW